MISMTESAILGLLLLLDVFHACHGTEYYNVWPLGEKTCGYDVYKERDAIQPKCNSCWIQLSPNTSLLSYKPLALDGSVFVDLESSALNDKDFAIMIHFQPFLLQGTLFHLQSQCKLGPCMTSLEVSLNATGSLHVKKIVNGETSFANVVVGQRSQVGSWSYFGVGTDVSSCKMKMFHGINNPPTTGGIEIFGDGNCKGFRNQSTLRIGGKWDGTDAFAGEVTCGSIMDGTEPKWEPAITSWCQRGLPAPQAPIFGLRPVHVFPLYDENAGNDVISKSSFRRSQHTKDVRPSGISDPAVPQGSLRMDGSALSTVDLGLSHFLLQQDFVLAFHVKRASNSQGTLAHAATVPAMGTGVRQLFVGVNQTHVEAVFKTGDGMECSHLVITTSSWPDMTWGVVAVGRSGSSSFLASKDQVAKGNVACSGATVSTGVETTLRLGGSFDDEEEGFHGNMACLGVFNVSFMSASLISSSVESCNKTLGMKFGSAAEAARETFYKFSAVRADARPRVSLVPSLSGPEVGFGSDFPSRSLADCARKCALRRHCRSFAVTKVKGRGKGGYCQLFDFLTRASLETVPGTNYFGMTVTGTLNP